MCVLVALLSIRYGSKDIKKIDWWFLGASLAAIPLWIICEDPTASAVLVTMIEIVAAFSTIRKSWIHPEQENALSFGIHSIRFMLALFALEVFSIATVAYPVGMVFMNGMIFLILEMRRRVLKVGL